jgi:hypothetical protein
MRNTPKATLVLVIAAIAASGFVGDAGCSPSKPTEIVPGALSQVKVPLDLAAIKLIVLANGAQKFCQGYQVQNGLAELPTTLGVIGGTSSTTLRVSLYGYDAATASGSDVNACSGTVPVDTPAGAPGGPGARVLREAVLTYVDQHTLFLPMPLSFSCYDVDCSSQGSDKTCKAGQCGDVNVPVGSLPDFDPSLVDGTQDCFSPSQCFAAAAPAVAVDPAHCIWGLPAGAPSTQGFNVRIAYAQNTWAKDPGTGNYAVQPGVPIEQEILSQDAVEGFAVPDPSKPSEFTLAPGLCALAQAAATPPAAPTSGTKTFPVISEVQVAVGCASKPLLLPFCAAEQHANVSADGGSSVVACGVPITAQPTSSAVYVIADDSASMAKAFGPKGYATVMNLSFADPVFKRTYIAFTFLSHQAAECGGTTPTKYLSPKVDWGLPSTVQPQIGPLLLTPPTPPDTTDNPAELDLVAAMGLTEGAFKHVLDFQSKLGGGSSALNGASVMFFVNRTPVYPAIAAGDAGAPDGGSSAQQRTSGTDCNPAPAASVQAAIESAATAASAQGLHTYFVVLDNDDHQPPLSFFQKVQSDLAGSGGTGGPVSVLDATSVDPSVVLGNFEQTITSSVTCVYDLPQGIDTTASVTFTVPANTPGLNPSASGVPVPVQLASGCKVANRADAANNGWNIDGKHLVLCGSSCQNLQSTIEAVTAAALVSAGDAGTSVDAGAIQVPDVPVNVTMPCSSSGSP